MVVQPVLASMARARPALQSPAAEELIIGTACQESLLGYSLRQHPTGPARGIFQIEPATFDDLFDWLNGRGDKKLAAERRDLLACVVEWASPLVPLGAQVAGNLYFATAIARMNYYRKPFTLSPNPTVEELAIVWKKWWNTPTGKGHESEFLKNYRDLAHT